MAKSGKTNVGGGGGIGSDELSVTKKRVLKGDTYVGADTNDEIGVGELDLGVITATSPDMLAGKVGVDKDGNPVTGTLALTGNASDGQVLAGSTYYSTDPKTKRTGTIPVRGLGVASTSRGLITQGLYFRIPYGYYYESSADPWVYSTRADVASAIGLTASKMIKGQSCLDLSGSTDWIYTANESLFSGSFTPTTDSLTNIQTDQSIGNKIWEGSVHPEWPYAVFNHVQSQAILGKNGGYRRIIFTDYGVVYKLTFDRDANGYTRVYFVANSATSTYISIKCIGGTTADING